MGSTSPGDFDVPRGRCSILHNVLRDCRSTRLERWQPDRRCRRQQREPLSRQLRFRRPTGQQQDLHGRWSVGRKPENGQFLGVRHGPRHRNGFRHYCSGRRGVFILADADALSQDQRDEHGNTTCRWYCSPVGPIQWCPRCSSVAASDHQRKGTITPDCGCGPRPCSSPLACSVDLSVAKSPAILGTTYRLRPYLTVGSRPAGTTRGTHHGRHCSTQSRSDHYRSRRS